MKIEDRRSKNDDEKEEDLHERLMRLGVALVELRNQLPGSLAGRHIASQLLRRGTPPAPNYAEARGVAYDGVTELVDLPGSGSPTDRFLEQIWFGDVYCIKARAFVTAE